MNNQKFEQQIMELIVNAGQCRSLLMQAIQKAKLSFFEEAEALIQQAERSLQQAHKQQTGFIAMDEGEGKLPITIILVHAQDHIMNAVLLLDLAKEIIAIYQKLESKNYKIVNR